MQRQSDLFWPGNGSKLNKVVMFLHFLACIIHALCARAYRTLFMFVCVSFDQYTLNEIDIAACNLSNVVSAVPMTFSYIKILFDKTAKNWPTFSEKLGQIYTRFSIYFKAIYMPCVRKCVFSGPLLLHIVLSSILTHIRYFRMLRGIDKPIFHYAVFGSSYFFWSFIPRSFLLVPSSHFRDSKKARESHTLIHMLEYVLVINAQRVGMCTYVCDLVCGRIEGQRTLLTTLFFPIPSCGMIS